jgi:hypothetical protein
VVGAGSSPAGDGDDGGGGGEELRWRGGDSAGRRWRRAMGSAASRVRKTAATTGLRGEAAGELRG